MIPLLCSILPIAVYLIVLRSFDAFSMVRWRSMALWMMWGMVSAATVLAIVSVARFLDHAWISAWPSPLIEETIKALPLAILVSRRKVVFLAETQLYGQAIGGGFALFENFYYLSRLHDMTIATALIRGLGTALLHMGCTALVASLLLILVTRNLSRYILRFTVFLCILPSFLIHLLHNISPFAPATNMLIVVFTFFLAFWIIADIGERNIIRWLDISLQDDVKLLSDLHAGRLLTTRAGEYLNTLKSRFEPLVFFDMCVYMQLYLELLMASKAQVMLRDAGLPINLTPEQKELRKSQFNELKAIAKRLPALALYLLRPLIHATDKDQWALQQFVS